MQVTGNLSQVASSTQLLSGVRADHPTAGVDDRPPGVGECLGGEADLLLVAVGCRLVTRQVDVRHRLVRDVRAAQVLRDVDDDRSGAPGAGDMERLVDCPRELERMLDHEAVLDDRHRDADRVRLLEAVGPEQFGSHLPGQEHDGHRVHHRVADRGHEVRRTGPAGPERHADLAGRLRIALGSVSAAGLVTHENVPDAGVVERVICRQVRAAGKAEYDVDTFRLQTFH